MVVVVVVVVGGGGPFSQVAVNGDWEKITLIEYTGTGHKLL